MKRFVCTNCEYVVDVPILDLTDECIFASFKGVFPCYNCEQGHLVHFKDFEELYPDVNENLTMEQFHLAVALFGTPAERMDPKTVLNILKTSPITDVRHELVEGKHPRLIIKSVTCKDGAVLHFAPSNRGATIYKVTRGEGRPGTRGVGKDRDQARCDPAGSPGSGDPAGC